MTNADILAAAGRADNKLSPVTLPSNSNSAVTTSGTFYGAPMAGYEKYATGTYKWSEASADDYMSFSLQFRVLDIDGKKVDNDKDPAMFATNVYLTDLTIAENEDENTDNGKEDIASAVRLLIDGTANDALLAQGASDSASNIVTDTHGSLDLNLNGDLDNDLDVPGDKYSFNRGEERDLDYGSDLQYQVAYNSAYKATASVTNGLYPKNDGYGNLSDGKPLGVSVANTANTAFDDEDYLTIDFKLFLEGWQDLTESDAKDTDATTPRKKIWDSAKYIGSQFNVGMSFGVTRLNN